MWSLLLLAACLGPGPDALVAEIRSADPLSPEMLQCAVLSGRLGPAGELTLAAADDPLAVAARKGARERGLGFWTVEAYVTDLGQALRTLEAEEEGTAQARLCSLLARGPDGVAARASRPHGRAVELGEMQRQGSSGPAALESDWQDPRWRWSWLAAGGAAPHRRRSRARSDLDTLTLDLLKPCWGRGAAAAPWPRAAGLPTLSEPRADEALDPVMVEAVRAYADLSAFLHESLAEAGPDIHLVGFDMLVVAGVGPCVATPRGEAPPQGDPAIFRWQDSRVETVSRVRGVAGIGDGSRLRGVRAEDVDLDARVRFEWESGRVDERWLLPSHLLQPTVESVCGNAVTGPPTWMLSELSRADVDDLRFREQEARQAERGEDLLIPVRRSSSR